MRSDSIDKTSDSPLEQEMNIQELENTFIEDLNALGDWFLQTEYLMALSARMKPFEEKDKSEDRRIRTCQSGVWLILTYENGRIGVRADSDSFIIRGILAVFTELLNQRYPEEILTYKPRFMDNSGVEKQLSAVRAAGIASVFQSIHQFAEKCEEQSKKT